MSRKGVSLQGNGRFKQNVLPVFTVDFHFLGRIFVGCTGRRSRPYVDLYYTLEIDHLIKVSFRNVMSSIRQFILMVCSSNP